VAGPPIVAILVCHSGSSPHRDLAPLRALGAPVVDLIAARPYVEQQSLLDDSEPNGLHYYWKTEFIPGLSADILRTFADHALRMTPPLSNSVIFHIGGALNERDVDDGAVGNRDARYVMGFAGEWTPDVPPDEHVAWVRKAWQAIRPFSTGGNYVNFQLAETITPTAAAWQELRIFSWRAVRPNNLFRVNRNISPSP
jgi:hypothetical protein